MWIEIDLILNEKGISFDCCLRFAASGRGRYAASAAEKWYSTLCVRLAFLGANSWLLTDCGCWWLGAFQ
jgi:hypothetical protein